MPAGRLPKVYLNRPCSNSLKLAKFANLVKFAKFKDPPLVADST